MISKFAINAIRAFTLFLAVLPLMALPVVFGGVPASQIVFWIFRHILGLSIALSAGMLASTLYRDFIRAASVAESSASRFSFSVVDSPASSVLLAGRLLLVVFTIQYCSSILKSRWEKDSAGYGQPLWVRLFLNSELSRTFFHWNTQKARSHHPIAWLQEYSWTDHLAKWGWCALVIVAQMFIVIQGTISNQRQNLTQCASNL